MDALSLEGEEWLKGDQAEAKLGWSDGNIYIEGSLRGGVKESGGDQMEMGLYLLLHH